MRGQKDAPALAPGPIRDHTGAVIGRHKGVAFYTIGQRSGLGVSRGAPRYVTRIDPATNTLHVGPAGADAVETLTTRDAVWTAGRTPEAPFDALVRVRYRHTPAPARITPDGDGFRAQFLSPQRGVSPGQAAVLYRDTSEGREVIGGGTIMSTTGGAP